MVRSTKKSDVSFYRKSKVAADKTEAAITFGWLEITKQFQLLGLTPHFRPDPTRIRHCQYSQTFPDVNRLPNSKWRTRKPEAEITIERNELTKRFQRLPLHLRPSQPDMPLTLPTVPDVAELPEFKTAATKLEVEITYDR